MDPFGAFFTGRRVKEHHAVLPVPPKMLDQRGMGDEFLVRIAFHSNSPQLGPEAASTSPSIGASGNSRTIRRERQTRLFSSRICLR